MSNYAMFSVLGIEIEYMLVDPDDLDVQAKSDMLIKSVAGKQTHEAVLGDGDIALSNELVMHVLELKTNGPQPPEVPIALQFQQAIHLLQPFLKQLNLQLLPTGAHPWMNPLTETQYWPHHNQDIYHQYDRIFNCQGHGWANLQSMHLNLPFTNDAEFCQLHNSIRILLPLLPALVASTPFLNGEITGLLSSRLYFYGKNQQRIPSISGEIIPEFICSEEEYQQTILKPMYHDISKYDPKNILQHEWLNSRGAIPKFAHKAIEIRILDSQECVQADISIALAIHAILQNWQRHSTYYLEKPCDNQRLKTVYDQVIKDGFAVTLDDAELFRQWQLPKKNSMSCRNIWAQLIEQISTDLPHDCQSTLEYLLSQGNLSERLLRACNDNCNRSTLKQLYHQLGDCLLTNQLFYPS